MRADKIAHPIIASLIALTPFAVGCGKSGDAGGPRTVTGTSRDTYVTEQGAMELPNDLSSYKVSALVLEGSDFRELLGSGQADGTFSIADVPGGFYWLKLASPDTTVKPQFFYTDATSVDMGTRRLERPGLVFPKLSTLVQMNVTNLLPWNANCFLELQVPTQGTRWSQQSPYIGPGNDGATALLVDVMLGGSASYNAALLDPGLGDRMTMLQICPSPTEPSNYTVQRYGTTTPPKMVDGQEAQVSFALMDAPQNKMLRTHWQRSAFAALTTAISPELDAQDVDKLVQVYPAFGDNTYGTPDVISELVTYRDAGITDVDLNLAYANPNPTSWFIEIPFEHKATVMRTAPGQATPARISRVGIASTYAASSDAMATPLDAAPIVSPVQLPKIAERDAVMAQTAIGSTPTLAWSAPQKGTPDLYAIHVYTFDANRSTDFWQLGTTLYTTTPSVKLPSGVLTPGAPYVFDIQAQSRGRTDLGSAPLRRGYPTGIASMISGVMQVN